MKNLLKKVRNKNDEILKQKYLQKITEKNIKISAKNY